MARSAERGHGEGESRCRAAQSFGERSTWRRGCPETGKTERVPSECERQMGSCSRRPSEARGIYCGDPTRVEQGLSRPDGPRHRSQPTVLRSDSERSLRSASAALGCSEASYDLPRAAQEEDLSGCLRVYLTHRHSQTRSTEPPVRLVTRCPSRRARCSRSRSPRRTVAPKYQTAAFAILPIRIALLPRSPGCRPT